MRDIIKIKSKFDFVKMKIISKYKNYDLINLPFYDALQMSWRVNGYHFEAKQ